MSNLPTIYLTDLKKIVKSVHGITFIWLSCSVLVGLPKLNQNEIICRWEFTRGGECCAVWMNLDYQLYLWISSLFLICVHILLLLTLLFKKNKIFYCWKQVALQTEASQIFQILVSSAVFEQSIALFVLKWKKHWSISSCCFAVTGISAAVLFANSSSISFFFSTEAKILVHLV